MLTAEDEWKRTYIVSALIHILIARSTQALGADMPPVSAGAAVTSVQDYIHKSKTWTLFACHCKAFISNKTIDCSDQR
eukprot:6184711-Pleurochrysis_carterae.AAC.1